MKYYVIDFSHPVDFLSAGKSKLEEDWMHYERTANHFILYMVTSGAFHLKVDDVPYSFFPGDVFLMSPFSHHIGFKAAAVTFYWMHFFIKDVEIIEVENFTDVCVQDKSGEKLLFPSQFRPLHTENFIILVNQLIHHFCDEGRSYFNNYLATSILLELQLQTKHASLQQQSSHKNRRFEEITAYIKGNYRENLSSTGLAEIFGYNPKYLVRLFRQHTGTTITGYINDVRLKMAEQYLLNSNDPISLVAHKSGYANEYYFMRLFKQKYNMSPSRYRSTYYMQNLSKY